MYIALVRLKVSIVRTDWRVLVILHLLESASCNFSRTFGFHDLQAAENCSGFGRKQRHLVNRRLDKGLVVLKHLDGRGHKRLLTPG